MTKEIVAYGDQGLNRGEGTLSPPPTGDRPLSPLGWATGPCRPLGGDMPSFFFSRDFVANLKKKKITFETCSPPIGRPGYIFEIFQNGHIFLKF